MPNNTKTLIDLEKTASFLGVSTATIRNWVKCGHLQTQDEDKRYFFHLSEIENVKNNIVNGDLNKLNGRANKLKAERTFIPDEYLKDETKINDLTKVVNFATENNLDVFTSLFLLSLNLLKKEKLITNVSIQDLTGDQNLIFANKQIGEEIKSWLSAPQGFGEQWAQQKNWTKVIPLNMTFCIFSCKCYNWIFFASCFKI